MIEGFKVDKVIFDQDNSTKAIGVQGLWTARNDSGEFGRPEGCVTREIIIRAKKVIVSSGTLWSPIILQNSGLRVSHFRHPQYFN